MIRMLRSSLILAAVAGLTACGGGSSPTAAKPVPDPVSTAFKGSESQLSAKLTFTIPSSGKKSSKRSRKYVSAASLGAVVTATPSSSGAVAETYGYDLSAAGVCTVPASGPETCTLDIPLYAGTYSITVALYDQNESANASAPVGNLLSTATTSETIASGELNTLPTILLHAQVDYFDGTSTTSDIDVFGASGGTASANAGTYTFIAEDADKYEVDAPGNATTTYANAPLSAAAADTGDATGCTSACFSATNDVGTTPPSTALISQASDETFTLKYSGGGGPGAGVRNSAGGAQPTGQQPYAGVLTATAAKGTDTATVAPLFAYPASVSIAPAATAYVWAAQDAPPTAANQNGSSYAAYFGTPGTAECTSGSTTVATVGGGTYYAGYGTVYPVTANAPGSCTLTVDDGAGDTVAVPLTVTGGGTIITIPCPGGTTTPVTTARSRTVATKARMAEIMTGNPALVQSATGVTSATLPNDVTANDVLVLIAGDAPGSPTLSNNGAVAIAWSEFGAADSGTADMFAYTATVPSSGSIGTVSINDACNASFWIGEFANTSQAAIVGANAGGGGTRTSDSVTTPSIVPNGGGLIVAGADSTADTAAATATSGYTEYFQSGPATSLDVQLSNASQTDTTDPLGLTFSPMANPDEALIFQIPPPGSTATPVPTVVRQKKAKTFRR